MYEIVLKTYKKRSVNNMTYEMKINRIVQDIDDIIIDILGTYDTSDLQTIIENLVCNHTFTSKDSIQELIYGLEKLKDVI